jgi:predicted 3-demethylubiquinone-9 3-methyltransferase (glyoxalase superfamily)
MASTNPAPTGAVRAAGSERTEPRQQKIVPFLWFDKNAEEAVNFYVSIFKNSKVLKSVRYGDTGPGPKGTIMTIEFQLDGQEFTAINGGPDFKFNEAVSLVVHCQTQEEVDYYWQKLSDGGQIIECGWLKDKFGLAWQITPDILLDLLSDSNPERTQRVMKAMMQMKKLDIKALKAAAEGK